MSAKVVYVHGDDWCGLYVDGVLVTEGHSISPTAALRHAGIDCEIVEADGEWLYESGGLPDKLGEVKRS